MSVERWIVLALVVLLPLLEALARFRRAHASNGEVIDRAGDGGTSQGGFSRPNRVAHDAVVRAAKEVVSPLPSPPPLLPQRASSPATSLSGLPANHALSSKGSASSEAHSRTGKPVADDAVVQWLRPVRNLRRAIVVATILGPPTR